MTLSANSYGSVAGVASYVKRLANALSGFDESTQPTLIEVESYLDQQSAKLNGWLAVAGYTIPVTQATARLILDNYANIGAAGLAELSQRSSGYSKDDTNRRENKFLEEFKEAKAYIESQAFQQLGAEHADTAEAPNALSFVTANYGADAADEFTRPPDYWP